MRSAGARRSRVKIRTVPAGIEGLKDSGGLRGPPGPDGEPIRYWACSKIRTSERAVSSHSSPS